MALTLLRDELPSPSSKLYIPEMLEIFWPTEEWFGRRWWRMKVLGEGAVSRDVLLIRGSGRCHLPGLVAREWGM